MKTAMVQKYAAIVEQLKRIATALEIIAHDKVRNKPDTSGFWDMEDVRDNIPICECGLGLMLGHAGRCMEKPGSPHE